MGFTSISVTTRREGGSRPGNLPQYLDHTPRTLLMPETCSLLLAQPVALRAGVAFYVPYLALHDLAVVAGGVDHVAVARVDRDVGYAVAASVLHEEDVVAQAEVFPAPDLPGAVVL